VHFLQSSLTRLVVVIGLLTVMPVCVFSFLLQCLGTLFGIAMLTYLFVWQFVYHDPDLQDNFTMVLFIFLGLFTTGFAYFITQDEDDDREM
jgi:hypothetical protein